jgi:hypothetical protein
LFFVATAFILAFRQPVGRLPTGTGKLPVPPFAILANQGNEF